MGFLPSIFSVFTLINQVNIGNATNLSYASGFVNQTIVQLQSNTANVFNVIPWF
jgi:hypothetical protein